MIDGYSLAFSWSISVASNPLRREKLITWNIEKFKKTLFKGFAFNAGYLQVLATRVVVGVFLYYPSGFMKRQ